MAKLVRPEPSAPSGAASLKARSAAQRKSAERERKRALGLVKLELWLRPEHHERVRKYAERVAR